MSTDLEFRQGLPEINLPAIKVNNSQSSDDTNDVSSCVIQTEKTESDEECRTPTSPEHRIPVILSCPPAPRKPKVVMTSSKRKLCELEFFEIVEAPGEKEVELFFRSCYGLLEVSSKRRSSCT